MTTTLDMASPLPAHSSPDPDVARNVAIIMDGNGRWAESHGVPVEAGHREGTRALRRTVEAAIDLGVRSLAVYAFSTENWTRPPDEVAQLMEILGETIDRELPDLAAQGVRTRFFGRRDRVPDEARAKMSELEAATADRDRLDLWIAFDYGGRAELTEAARRLVADGVEPEDVDDDSRRRSSPIRTSSSARRGRSASRTSCSGSPPTQSSCSRRHSGRTSATQISETR